MAKGKFFNVDLEDNDSEVKPRNVNQARKPKYFQNGLNFSNEDKRLLLMILGGFCIIGFLYYVIAFLVQK